MATSSSTDTLIKELLDATYGQEANFRQKFVFKQALLGLVRVAKAEQVFEMRTTVEKLIGGAPSNATRQRTKSRQANPAHSGSRPQQMQFSQFD